MDNVWENVTSSEEDSDSSEFEERFKGYSYEFPEYESENENLVAPSPNLGAITPDAMINFVGAAQMRERWYQNCINVEKVDDEDLTGYSDEIQRNLKRVAQFLKLRRQYRCIRFFAFRSRYLPPIIEEDKDFTRVLNRESPEIMGLLGEKIVQIKNTDDVDAARYLAKGNGDPKLLPTFWLPNRCFFGKLSRELKGLFGCVIKYLGAWNLDVEYGGINPDVDGDEPENSMYAIIPEIVQQSLCPGPSKFPCFLYVPPDSDQVISDASVGDGGAAAAISGGAAAEAPPAAKEEVKDESDDQVTIGDGGGDAIVGDGGTAAATSGGAAAEAPRAANEE